MWRCPKCQSKVDDSFDVCWSCGTTADGIEDPDFVIADEAEPIDDQITDDKPKSVESLEDFAGTPFSELVECHMASNTIEAKFIADRLMEEGIPAIADKHDINLVMGGFQPTLWGYGPKVRVRAEDLSRAQIWIKDYNERLQIKAGEPGLSLT